MRYSEYPRAERVLLHLSDTHLRAGGSPLYDRVDSEAYLARAVAAIEGSGIRPNALVFTGDLADFGEADAYERVRALVSPWPSGSPLASCGSWATTTTAPRSARACSPATTPNRPPQSTASTSSMVCASSRSTPLCREPTTVRCRPINSPGSPRRWPRPRLSGRSSRCTTPRSPASSTWPRRWSCATSAASRRSCAAPTCARSSPVTCTTPRSPRSPASPCRWHPRPATRRTSWSRWVARGRKMPLRASTSCTSTTRRRALGRAARRCRGAAVRRRVRVAAPSARRGLVVPSTRDLSGRVSPPTTPLPILR